MISRKDVSKMQDFVGKTSTKTKPPMETQKMAVRGNKNQKPPKGK